MTTLKYCPVTQVDFEAFTAAFNRAYHDYFVPIAMTPASFKALMVRDDIDPGASVAVLDGGDIVGTGLLGIRGKAGWIGGLGVVPDRRREGIGRQIVHHLLDGARERALTQVTLEVIEANQKACALYRQLGFADQRYLVALEYAPGMVPDPVTNYAIGERAPAELLAYYAEFHDLPNCWQREHPSLAALADQAHGWAALEDGHIVGYAIGWAGEHAIRLVDFATTPRDGQRHLIAQAVLSHLHRAYPGAHAASFNVAEDDPVLDAYKALGYQESFRQIEMRMEL